MRSALILLGGSATRAEGRPKQFFRFNGESFIRRQIRILERITDEIILVGKEETPGDLPVQDPIVRYTTDIRKGEGPAGGIHAGMQVAKGELVFVTACDMPFLSGEMIAYLFQICTPEVDAVVPQWEDGFAEPLHSVYRRTVVQEYFSRHQTKQLIQMIHAIRYRFIPVSELIRFDPDLLSFKNINDLKSLDEIQKISP